MFPGDVGIVIGKSGSYLIIRKLTEALTVRHYSEHTKQCYKKWVEDFLKDLALKKHVSASTQNQALAALPFYFRFVKNTGNGAELGNSR